MAQAVAPDAQLLPNEQVQADFYAKLFRLRDDLVAKRHPRLSLPDSVLKELAAIGQQPLQLEQQKQQQKQLAAPPTKSGDLIRAETLLKRQRLEKTLARAVDDKRTTDRLTKSRDKDYVVWDAPNTVDAGKALEAALKLVPPVSGWVPVVTATKSPSVASSFDENEYYSSQVMSAATSASDRSVGPPAAAATAEPAASIQGGTAALQTWPGQGDERVNRNVTRNQILRPPPQMTAQGLQANTRPENVPDTVSVASSSLRDESYSPPAADAFQRPVIPQFFPSFSLPPPPPPFTVLPPPPPPPAGFPLPIPPNMIPGLVLSQQEQRPPSDQSRGRESESYSPPAPMASSAARNGNVSAPVHAQHHQNASSNENGTGQRQKGKKDRADGKSKKQKRKEQREQQQQQQQAQAQAHAQAQAQAQAQAAAATAAFTPALNNPRKRGRDVEGNADDSSRRASGHKRIARAVESPVPYIKPEPVSPPPLSVDLPPSNEPPRRLIMREDGRPDVQVESPGQISRTSARNREQHNAEYLSDEELSSPRYPQQMPDPHRYTMQAAKRRVASDGSDLRRIASYQNAMRPLTPEYPPYPADAVAYMRTPSRMVSARPVSRMPDYYTQGQPYRMPSRRYETFEEPPYHQMMERHAMPPPLPMPDYAPQSKRRIVVDEFGDEWVAMRAPPNMRQSMAREMPREMAMEHSMQPPPYTSPRSSRVPARTFESSMRFRQPRVVDLELDDEDDYSPRQDFFQPPSDRQLSSAMPPPHAFSVRQPSRAASMAPFYPRDAAPQRMPVQFGYDPETPSERARLAPRDRSFSTRPDLAQQAAFYGQSNEYDPRAPTMLWQQPR